MRCPLCVPAQMIEQSLLDHLLANHPGVRAAAGLGMSAGTIVFARRPSQLLGFYAAVLFAAMLLSLPPRSTT